MTTARTRPYLGKLFEDGREHEHLRYPGERNLLTIGPPGSGKGMALIVPNLAHLERSILVIDPKGQAAAITARRRSKLGRVVMLNPFALFTRERPWLTSHGFNPLLGLDPRSQSFITEATSIAAALIEVDPRSREPHWSQSAQDLLCALIMWECLTAARDGRVPTLSRVRDLLTEPLVRTPDGDAVGFLKTIFEIRDSGFTPAVRKISRFASATNEMQGIISTAITQTSFLDLPEFEADLAKPSDFRFADMKEEIVTVYLILPTAELDNGSKWLRLLVVRALSELLRTPRHQTKPPVLFVLDEFAQLGNLPPVRSAMNTTRDYGVQIWPILQSLVQLKSIYGDSWETLFGTCGAVTAYAPRDYTTAKYLSDMCGQKTAVLASESRSAHGAESSRGFQTTGFPVYRPEDLMTFPPNMLLCLAEGLPGPVECVARGYWETPFGQGLDSNPYAPASVE